ncbi:hypothetical protein RM553_08905 [Zunongwangia sp. F363]|uniref:Uncharacterized protein n=1 Tax=Autumnicola tepida TaxID=3075595 RepID=A0ABU3C9C9_9FLAO|nr:hypothetical protein [Zunongwangia sp. F363]MDT0642948.1 hypothetical protein [Zunongwangia sp. F363]
MKSTKIKVALLALSLGVATVSCEQDTVEEIGNNPTTQSLENKIGFPELIPQGSKTAVPETSENLGVLFRNAVAPSECSTTELTIVQNKYITDIINDPVALANNGIYSDLNYYYSYYLADGDQYFGAEGDYTKLMIKRQRELVKFWDMPVEIRVNGQHTATLNDRDKIAEVFENFYGFRVNGVFVPLTTEQAYAQADIILELNESSPNLPENPYFATDGFASTNRTIVIGDGLPTWLSETGIDEGIVWTGILAHEWAHEIQFLNYADWYPYGAAQDPAADTRYTELEADFMAAYYMTHKRGATYNWKRVEEFFDLYFQIGDCGFSSSGHHGTPLQRLEAARQGYELAHNAHKQGHILTQQEVHEAFVSVIGSIVD